MRKSDSDCLSHWIYQWTVSIWTVSSSSNHWTGEEPDPQNLIWALLENWESHGLTGRGQMTPTGVLGCGWALKWFTSQSFRILNPWPEGLPGERSSYLYWDSRSMCLGSKQSLIKPVTSSTAHHSAWPTNKYSFHFHVKQPERSLFTMVSIRKAALVISVLILQMFLNLSSVFSLLSTMKKVHGWHLISVAPNIRRYLRCFPENLRALHLRLEASQI